MSGHPFGSLGKGGPFVRCECGAVGLATCEPAADRFRVAGEVLRIPARLWADPTGGLDRVEWRITERWSRLRQLEELVSGQEIWVVVLWGRRRTED
jgi:hypothetical protein